MAKAASARGNSADGCTVTSDMRRVLGLLVAALVVVGCTDHESASRPTTSSTTTTSTPSGFAVGYMRVTGGPTRRLMRLDQRLPGVVEVHHPGDLRVVTSVTVGGSGRFRIGLLPGRYQLLGRPANRGLMSMTSKAFRVVVGRTVTVDLVEYAT
jgi:hypothetical protein